MRSAAGPGLVALLAASLSACAVGPDFHAPAAPAGSGYTSGTQPAQTVGASGPAGTIQQLVTGMEVPGQWWQLFGSQALDELMARALEANPTLQAAQATLREAQALLHADEGAFYPQFAADASHIRERQSGAAFGQPNASRLLTLNSASVSVSYLLDLWGGTRRQVESLAAQAQFQRFELEASYLTLTTNLAATAVEEAQLRGRIAAVREIVGIDQQELAGQRRQFEIGATADTAVLAQAAALAQAQAELAPLQKQLEQTRNALSAYVGQLPSQPPSQTFELDSLRLPAMLPESLPAQLVEQRPDIRAAQAQMHAALAQVGVATANLLPQITLTGSFGSESAGRLFSAGSRVWGLAAGLSAPLFEGGRLRYQRRAAVEAYQATAARYRQTVISAFEQVADALRAVELDAEELAADATAEQAAADSLAASQRQYHAGAISYLSLLTAEQTYQQTRLALVQAQAARYSDSVALFGALGGGWWNRNDTGARPPPAR